MGRNNTAYNMHNLFVFHIERGSLGKRLSRLLQKFIVDEVAKDSIDVKIGYFSKKHTDIFISKHYKLIPWQAGLKYENGKLKKIFFYSPAFNSFLFFRLVIIPYLMKEIIKKGGIYILGTAFQLNQQESFFIFAKPGSGKTKAMLSLFENKNFNFIGDGSFLISHSTCMIPILPELELRYDTVKPFKLWKKLTSKDKVILFIYKLLSNLTLRKISFNISLNPELYGFEVINDFEEANHNFILIDNSVEQIKNIDKSQILLSIKQYLADYSKTYYYIYEDDIDSKQLEENIKRFLENIDNSFSCSSKQIANIFSHRFSPNSKDDF